MDRRLVGEGVHCVSFSLGLTWFHLVLLGFTWFNLALLGLTWFHLVNLVSLGSTCFHLDSLSLQGKRGNVSRACPRIFIQNSLDIHTARTHARHDTISRLDSPPQPPIYPDTLVPPRLPFPTNLILPDTIVSRYYARGYQSL